jgi:hypothetical protein
MSLEMERKERIKTMRFITNKTPAKQAAHRLAKDCEGRFCHPVKVIRIYNTKR